VTAAYLPSLLQGVARRGGTPGWQFQLCIEIIQHLKIARGTLAKGLTLSQLAVAMKVDNLQLEPVIEALAECDYAAEIADGSGRFILLCEPEKIAMAPLVNKLLLAQSDSVAKFLAESQAPVLTAAHVIS
jgi:membrane protein